MYIHTGKGYSWDCENQFVRVSEQYYYIKAAMKWYRVSICTTRPSGQLNDMEERQRVKGREMSSNDRWEPIEEC